LLHDPVALKEIKDRIIESEDEMSILLNNTFWNFTENYQIYDSGSFRTLKNSKALRALISERFDKIYPKTPVTKNELLNRYKVSGSVNRACKLVCFNMAKKVTERDIKKNPELGDKLDSPLYLGSVDLGLTGTSAEATIFRLMYQKSGLYSERAGGEFNFGAPTETSWIPFWEEVNAFINARAGEDIQVVEIISHFEQKPFGMRRPIIIMALIALLKMQNTGIAVFNENTYEPELTEIVLELFLRQPKHFAIRKNRDLETRNLVLEVFFQGFFPKLNFDEHKADAVFMIVKEIYRSFRILPAYANQTRSVSENARNIRNVLIRANRPEELLFTDLPKALGFEENLKDNANKYVCSLKDTLSELVNALGNLKEKASKELFDRFKLPPKATLTDVREELGPRCDVVSQLTDDAYIKNFASKGHNTIYLDDKWLDVLLGAIASKPLTSWNDVDEKDFPNKLATLYRSFSNYELLKQEFIQQNDAIENAPQSDKKTTPVATAVTITTAGSKELQSVIGKYIDSDEVTLLKEQLKNTLGNNHHSVKEAALVSLLKEVIH
jgi:hypothetical protein